MPKFTRKRIARGIKLKPTDVYDPIGTAATALSSASTTIPAPTNAVTVENYDKENGTFRLNLTLPYIGSEWTRTNGTDLPYIIPFNLPHLQEFWNVDGLVNEFTPNIKLVEFSYGFDQRDEGGFVTDQWAGVGDISGAERGKNWDAYLNLGGTAADLTTWSTNLNAGKIYAVRDDGFRNSVGADLASRGNLIFSLHEKAMRYYPGSNRDEHREVYNLPVPIAALIGSEFKANPFVETGININISPYSTYLVGIRPPRLHDDRGIVDGAPANLALVNLTISLKFKHVLVQRDSTALAADPPNLPQHGSLKVQDVVTINTPANATPIEASTNDGVQTSLETLDQRFRDKLQGGLSDLSDRGVVEQVCEDAGYEIIAIPMWNNQWNNQSTIKHAVNIGTMPYQYGVNRAGNVGRVDTIGNTDLQAPICDRAIIPISYPMTIHHVIVAHNALTTTIVKGENSSYLYHYADSPVPANYANPAWLRSSAATVKHHIGVAAGRGIKGGEYGYKAIANYEGHLGGDHQMDDIRMDYNTTSPAPGVASAYEYPDGKNDYNLSSYPQWTMNYLPLSTGGAVAPGLFTTAGVKATTATMTAIQGAPIFVGNSFITPDLYPPGPYAVAGAAAGTSVRVTTPETQDEWLEVRWNITPDGTVGDNWTTFGGGTGDNSRIINGYGGSWIYIIGKKSTVSDQNWQKPYYKKGL